MGKPLEATGDWRQYVTSDTLQAVDLQGKHCVVVIQRVTQATMTDRQDSSKEKGVLNVYFKGKRKPLVVKAEMSAVITKIVGSRKCADWIGKAIEIYPTRVWAFGQNHDVVRIVERAPSQADAKVAAEAKSEPEPPATDMKPDEIREKSSAMTAEEIAEIKRREAEEAGRAK
jgi:hypothetical protein